MLLRYLTLSVLVGLVSFLYLNGLGPLLQLRNAGTDLFKSALKVLRFSKENGNTPQVRVFSREELRGYDGTGSSGFLYLAVLGKVYDVTKGRHHYAPGGTYHGFTGLDGSKAFITGDFSEEGLTDDVSDLDKEELMSLFDWTKMYEKTYTYKGIVEGRFYDSDGKPTTFLKDIEKKITEVEEEKKNSKKYEQKYPPCNSEWNQDKGGRVWCSNKSGGVVRSWIGVPRKYYEPGSSTARCACINLSQDKKEAGVRHGSIEPYSDCPPEAHSCYINDV